MQENQQSSLHCSICGQPTSLAEGSCAVCDSIAQADSEALVPPLPSAVPRSSGSLARGVLLGYQGRYRIERMIGRGGFGEAYLATDTQLERPCVVKRLSVPVQQQQDDFQREARLLVSLNTPGHASIPEIYEYLAESQCLVMKYIEGRSLEQLLNHRVTPLPEEKALLYIRDICSALVYMHSRVPEPVLHRDIKPANILLDSTERVWLIDFGLAKALPAQLPSEGIPRSRGMGTMGFTPPEQWQGAAEPRSDIFALSVTLYVLLTFYQPEPTELAALLRGQGPSWPPIRTVNSSVSIALERLLQRGMSYHIADRPSAQELLDELDSLVNTVPIAPLPALANPATPLDSVGRSAELDGLATALGAEHLAVITGMAGVGKTTLAIMLAQQIRVPDHTFWHSFHQDEGIEVIIWALAAFLARQGQHDVWHLLHTLRRTGGPPPPPEVLLDYVITLIRGRNYLLCLDDVHFIDEDPRFGQLVDRLQREVRNGALDLIMISRRVPPAVPLRAVTHLPGLSQEDAQLLLESRGVQLPEEVFAALYGVTEGNAQFLVLSSAALQDAEDPAQLAGRLLETNDIEQYLLTQVDSGLTEEMRDVLSAIALLLHQGGTREAIEAILDRGRLQRILHELLRRQLVMVREGEAGKVYQLHTIVQAFYYDQLRKQERVVLHRRAGVFYECEQIDLCRSAYHFLSAGEAARAARLVSTDIWPLINQGQVGALRQILEHLSAQQLPSSLWIAVCIARGEVYAVLRESDLARASYTEALEHLAALQASAMLHLRSARVCRGMGELLEYEAPQQALDWLRRGLAELAGAASPGVAQEQSLEEALLRLRIGSVLIAMGEYATARSELEASLELLPTGPNQWRASALLKLGVIHCAQGQTQLGKAAYLQALDIHQRLHNFWGMIGVWHNLGIELVYGGDWAGAEAEYGKAIAMAEQLGNLTRRTTLELSLGFLYMNQGKMEAALMHLSSCLALACEHNLKEYCVSCQSSLADLHLRSGDWAAAQPLLEDAERLALEMNSKWQLPEIYRGWALVHLAQGRLDAAQVAADRALVLTRELEDPHEEGMSLRVLAQALFARARQEQAVAAFAGSLELLAERDPYEAARTRMQWGLALRSSGSDGSRALLQDAAATFGRLGAQGDLAILTAAMGV